MIHISLPNSLAFFVLCICQSFVVKYLLDKGEHGCAVLCGSVDIVVDFSFYDDLFHDA